MISRIVNDGTALRDKVHTGKELISRIINDGSPLRDKVEMELNNMIRKNGAGLCDKVED